MEKSNRFAQFYGYAVCLIAVVTLLIASGNAINPIFDLSRPLESQESWRFGGERLPATFELYRLEYRERGYLAGSRSQPAAPPEVGVAVIEPDAQPARKPMTDEELRRSYETKRAEYISSASFAATRSLVGGLFLVLLAVTLFLWHWRWLARLARSDRDAVAATREV
ncbi:MAG: hypothetical protein ACRENI_14845 [Gemmatimonadaceae bacterium]